MREAVLFLNINIMLLDLDCLRVLQPRLISGNFPYIMTSDGVFFVYAQVAIANKRQNLHMLSL